MNFMLGRVHLYRVYRDEISLGELLLLMIELAYLLSALEEGGEQTEQLILSV
jgi:hypothetical protein